MCLKFSLFNSQTAWDYRGVFYEEKGWRQHLRCRINNFDSVQTKCCHFPPPRFIFSADSWVCLSGTNMQRNNLARHLTLLTTFCFKETWVKFVPHHLHHSHGAAVSLKNLEHNDSLLWKLFLIVDSKGLYYIIYKLTLSGFYIRWCFCQIYFMIELRFLIKKKKKTCPLAV